MDVILCHTTADFDALGAAVGLTRLKPGAKIVLTGGAHPSVRDFLALHRDEYPLIERRSVNPKRIRSLMVVDTQQRDRLGKAAEWFNLPELESILVYDHHLEATSDIPATESHLEAVGATTTLIVEQIRQGGENEQQLTPSEATVMALGIHVDTGSLTYEGSTPRDALALAWLMQQGASLSVIADYIDSGLSPQLQELLTEALENLQAETVQGYQLAWVLLKTEGYVPGLSSLAAELIELTDSDALLLGDRYPVRSDDDERLTIIGRSRVNGTDLNQLFQPLGGGGHSQAASLTLRGVESENTLQQLVTKLKAQFPHPPTARELMSSPVRTILPQTTIAEASRILLRYGHSGLSVVNEQGQLVGIISRRDLDIALHHGFSHAPVKGYMSSNLKTITPDTPLPVIESLMVTYDVGRLPVLENNQLVGIVTRTDVLRQLHQDKERGSSSTRLANGESCPLPERMGELLRDRLNPQLWELLTCISQAAESRGWHLYLVGGAVRDLLLATDEEVLMLQDIDLVVDNCHVMPRLNGEAEGTPKPEGAGVILAKALQELYPDSRLQIHGRFQTAALLWHKDPTLGNLWIDIATARTEFYPYPAANPEVEASSIRQDLYRRDFTINALALRLTHPRQSELLDFFGGVFDLEAQLIRVLHANSFIEDPTRIYRAVRFAVRLGFKIEAQTESYIRYALESGVYKRSLAENSKAPALQTRLKSELKYILQENYWQAALKLLGNLGALRCIHPSLELSESLWKQMGLVDRCLRRFQSPELQHWQVLLEVLMSHIPVEARVKVANSFQLPTDCIKRLQDLEQGVTAIDLQLPYCQRPSEIVRVLREYDLETLILIAVKTERLIRHKIWQYLSVYAQVKSPLDGKELQTLGYPRGPQLKTILEALLVARLDGEIGNTEELQSDRNSALAFLNQHFPLG